jgi:hypothetical protein
VVDPFVGFRVRHAIGPSKELNLEGDVSGFGAGSDFSWQVVGTYGFDPSLCGTPFHAVLGYRALAVDFSENSKFGKNGNGDTDFSTVEVTNTVYRGLRPTRPSLPPAGGRPWQVGLARLERLLGAAANSNGRQAPRLSLPAPLLGRGHLVTEFSRRRG